MSPDGVRQLRGALQAVSEAAATGQALAAEPELPDDETLKPVTEAIRALLGVLGTGQRLSADGQSPRLGPDVAGRDVVGLAGFEPATSATQNCYEPRTRMLALH